MRRWRGEPLGGVWKIWQKDGNNEQVSQTDPSLAFAVAAGNFRPQTAPTRPKRLREPSIRLQNLWRRQFFPTCGQIAASAGSAGSDLRSLIGGRHRDAHAGAAWGGRVHAPLHGLRASPRPHREAQVAGRCHGHPAAGDVAPLHFSRKKRRCQVLDIGTRMINHRVSLDSHRSDLLRALCTSPPQLAC